MNGETGATISLITVTPEVSVAELKRQHVPRRFIDPVLAKDDGLLVGGDVKFGEGDTVFVFSKAHWDVRQVIVDESSSVARRKEALAKMPPMFANDEEWFEYARSVCVSEFGNESSARDCLAQRSLMFDLVENGDFDGCQFEACADQLKLLGIDASMESVRRDAVEWIRNNGDFDVGSTSLRQWIEKTNGKSLQEYAGQLEKGDEISLLAIREQYCVSIRLLTSAEAITNWYSEQHPKQLTSCKGVLWLGVLLNGFYWSLIGCRKGQSRSVEFEGESLLELDPSFEIEGRIFKYACVTSDFYDAMCLSPSLAMCAILCCDDSCFYEVASEGQRMNLTLEAFYEFFYSGEVVWNQVGSLRVIAQRFSTRICLLEWIAGKFQVVGFVGSPHDDPIFIWRIEGDFFRLTNSPVEDEKRFVQNREKGLKAFDDPKSRRVRAKIIIKVGEHSLRIVSSRDSFFDALGFSEGMIFFALSEGTKNGLVFAELQREVRDVGNVGFVDYLTQYAAGKFVAWEQKVTLRIVLEFYSIRLCFLECDENYNAFVLWNLGREDDKIMFVARSSDGQFLRLSASLVEDTALMLRVKKSLLTSAETFERRAKLHRGAGITDEDRWNNQFKMLREFGITALLTTYQSRWTERTLPGHFPSGDDGGNPPMRWYYEYAPDGKDSWREYVIPQEFQLPRRRKIDPKLFSVRGRVPALLFRMYLSRTGGNDAISQSVGDDCPPVELFHFFYDDEEIGWFPLENIPRDYFPSTALRDFLEEDLERLRQTFVEEYIGQDDARKAVMRDVVSQAVAALKERKPPLSVEKFNMVFTGEPGTGKTTFAWLIAKILYYAGMLHVGHTVSCVGTELGEGNSSSDSGAQQVKRFYQRSRHGLLFIDELYGITGGPSPSANQSSAVNAIVGYCIDGKHLTIGTGYKEDIQKYFFAKNQGLERRFIDVPFVRFTDVDLFEIFLLKAREVGIWSKLDREGKFTLRWLMAGYTAPRINGGFCEKLVMSLVNQRSAVQENAGILEMPFIDVLTKVDVLEAWFKASGQVTRASNMPTVVPKPRYGFAKVRKLKALAIGNNLLKALRVSTPLLERKRLPKLDVAGDGILEFVKWIIDESTELEEQDVSLKVLDSTRRVSIVLAEGYNFGNPPMKVPDYAIVTVSGEFWSWDVGTCSCLLFYHSVGGARHENVMDVEREGDEVVIDKDGMPDMMEVSASEEKEEEEEDNDVCNVLTDRPSERQKESLAVMQEFLREFCVSAPGQRIRARDFIARLNRWINETGKVALSDTMVGRLISKNNKEKFQDMYYTDIQFK